MYIVTYLGSIDPPTAMEEWSQESTELRTKISALLTDEKEREESLVEELEAVLKKDVWEMAYWELHDRVEALLVKNNKLEEVNKQLTLDSARQHPWPSPFTSHHTITATLSSFPGHYNF